MLVQAGSTISPKRRPWVELRRHRQLRGSRPRAITVPRRKLVGGYRCMHAGSLPEFAASVRLFAPSMHVDSLLCSIHHPTPPLFATLPPPLLTPTATATTTVVVSLSAAGSIFFVAYDTGTKEQFLVSIARAIRGPHKADAPPAPAPSSNAAADTAAAIFGTLGALGVAAAGEWYMRQLLVRYCCCYVGGVAALVRSFPT